MIEKFIERFAGLLGAALAVGCYAFFGLFGKLPANFTSLLEASVNVNAIAVGFLAGAKAILLSANDQHVVQGLRKAGQLKVLMGFFISAIWWCLAATFVSAILLVVDLDHAHRAVLGGWMGLIGGSIASCVRVVWNYNAMLKQFH